MRLSKGIK